MIVSVFAPAENQVIARIIADDPLIRAVYDAMPVPDVPVTVAWATADAGEGDGFATAGEDYTPAAGSVTFLPGETSRWVHVAVAADLLPEGDKETFFVDLADPTGAQIRAGRGTGSIEDDDSPWHLNGRATAWLVFSCDQAF